MVCYQPFCHKLNTFTFNIEHKCLFKISIYTMNMEDFNPPGNNFRSVWNIKKAKDSDPYTIISFVWHSCNLEQVFDLLANDGRNGDMVLLSKSAIEKLSTPVVIGSDTILLDESIYSMGMKLYRRFEGTSKVSCWVLLASRNICPHLSNSLPKNSNADNEITQTHLKKIFPRFKTEIFTLFWISGEIYIWPSRHRGTNGSRRQRGGSWMGICHKLLLCKWRWWLSCLQNTWRGHVRMCGQHSERRKWLICDKQSSNWCNCIKI